MYNYLNLFLFDFFKNQGKKNLTCHQSYYIKHLPPGSSFCTIDRKSYCYEKVFLRNGFIRNTQGCIDKREALIFCLKTHVNDALNETMRVMCCQGSDFCNDQLLKFNETDWSAPPYISDVSNILNGTIRTFFTYPLEPEAIEDTPREHKIIWSILIFIAIFLFFLILFTLFYKRKEDFDSILDKIKIEDKGEINTETNKIQKINTMNFDDMNFLRYRIGGYNVWTAKYNMNDVIIHAFKESKIKNFKNIFGIYLLAKPRHTSILEILNFGILKDNFSIKAFHNSEYLAIFDFKSCLSVNEVFEKMTTQSNKDILMDLVNILQSLANGLKYLHLGYVGKDVKKTILHRCLYTDSFYVSYVNGAPIAKITNFQYSCILKNQKGTLAVRSISGDPIRTCVDYVYYAPPEVLQETKYEFTIEDLPIDVYSLGCIIWKFYYVAFEILNQKAKFSHVFDKRFLKNHPYQNNFDVFNFAPRKMILEKLMIGTKLPKKVAESGNQYFPLLDKLYDISLKCLNFMPIERSCSSSIEAWLSECYDSYKMKFERK